jgi:hypothetical protein
LTGVVAKKTEAMMFPGFLRWMKAPYPKSMGPANESSKYTSTPRLTPCTDA